MEQKFLFIAYLQNNSPTQRQMLLIFCIRSKHRRLCLWIPYTSYKHPCTHKRTFHTYVMLMSVECEPQNSHFEVLTPNMLERDWLHWETGPSKRWLSYSVNISVGPEPMWPLFLQKRKFRYRSTAEGRPFENMGRRHPSISQEKQPQKELALPTTWSWICSLQTMRQ